MKKILLTLLFCLTTSLGHCAYEDYTSGDWTTTDDAGYSGDLTVTANRITFDNDFASRDNTDTVVKDEGTGGITDFAYEFQFTITAGDQNENFYSRVCLFGVTNEASADYDEWTTGIYLRTSISTSGTLSLILTEAGGESQSLSQSSTYPLTRYITIERYEDEALIRVYEDEARVTTPEQINIKISDRGYRYLYGFGATDDQQGNALQDGYVENLEEQTAPTSALPAPPLLDDYNNPDVQDDFDYFGGWTGLQATDRYNATAVPDRIEGTLLYDADADFPTIAEDGYDLSWNVLQPDANYDMYFVIQSNTADTLFILPSDRLMDRDVRDILLTNGDMELDSDWGDYGTPTTNERSTTKTTSNGTYTRHVIGDAANDGVQQTGIAINNANYKSIGYIWVVSGNVYLKVNDNDGEVLDERVGTLSGGKWESYQTSQFTSSYVGSNTGDMEFYCSGGACEFYLDDVVLGESGTGSYNSYVDLESYTNGTKYYEVYGHWRTEKINGRWWIIDPLDNVYIIKGSNNFDLSQIDGRDFDGNELCGNVKVKYDRYTSCTALTTSKLHVLNDLGFNNIGFFMTEYVKGDMNREAENDTSYPYINSVDMKFWSALSDVGYILSESGSYSGGWMDAYDADYIDDIKENAIGNATCSYDPCISWSFGSNDYYFQSGDKNPYFYRANNILSNMMIVGWNLGNEPVGSGGGYHNIGYKIMQSDSTSSSAVDGISDTKVAAVNWLRAKYTNGGEATFATNLDYDGSDEITIVGSWSGVTGYVATDSDADGTPDNDEAAITNLNTAWGTTFPTENADNITNAWVLILDDAYNASGGLSAVDGDGWLDGADADIFIDFNAILGNYNRKFLAGLWEAYFGPNAYFRDKKINFGFGYHWHEGWAQGFKSVDGNTTYTKVVSSGCGTLQDGPSIQSLNDDFLARERQGKSIEDGCVAYYDISGLPMYSESYWVPVETASYFGAHTGTVDAVYLRSDVDFAVYRGSWNCDGDATGFCSTATNDYKIAEDATVYWNCDDPEVVPHESCDTGVLHWQFNKTPDQPIVHGNFSNKYIVIADTGSIGNLENEDIITTGTKMFTINGTPGRVSLAVDEDANFDTDFNNPYALDNLFHNTTFINLSDMEGTEGHTIDGDPTDGVNAAMTYLLDIGWTTHRSLSPWKSQLHLGSGTGQYLGAPANFTQVAVGDRYKIGYLPLYQQPWMDTYKIIYTQEDRAKLLSELLRQQMDLQGTNNDYFMTGFSLWALWDYGYADYTEREVRAWGFITQRDNFYDGVEATTLGADGIADTWDDEEKDYGNFTGNMKAYFDGMYQDLGGSSGGASSGVGLSDVGITGVKLE